MLSDIAGVIRRPAGTLRRLAHAEQPPPRAVVLVVLISGLFAAALQVAGNQAEPYPNTVDGADQRLAGDILSATLPLLFAVFWFFEAGLVDAAARVMGAPERRSRYRRVVALTYPVLSLYAVVTFVQAVLDRVAGGVGVNDWLGYTNLLVLVWFIALATLAAREVYELPGLNALAAALLPYAVMTALLTMLSLGAALATVH